MHRSRIAGIFIDHPGSWFAASVAFWAAATGVEPKPRLSAGDNGRFWQMLDPGGIVFCVIPPHTPDFAEQAKVWP